MTLRVLHCIYDDPANPWVAGGGAVRVPELYRHLREEVEATVLTGSYPGARNETIDGIRYRRLGARGPYAWSRLSYAAAANRALRREPYDVAVFDFSVYTPIFIPRDRPAGLTVHHVTGPTAEERWGAMRGRAVAGLERGMIRRGRCISVTSGATAALVSEIAAPDTTLVPVGAGVPDALFEHPRSDAGFLLYFGRLDWLQKGLDVLLDAFARLAAGRPGLELRIAGRGKDAERVRARVSALGLEARVRMLGPVSEEERRALFSGASVLLMPSRFEGFGMVAAEAMAAGVPLVAAASGSLPEVVAPPDGGVLVPSGDAEALAEAVGALLADPARRQALSQSARRSAERFRWQTVARDHLRFLHEIRRTARPPLR